MITLTREEAQKLLDGFERVGWARTEHADILRARLAQPEPEPDGVTPSEQYAFERGYQRALEVVRETHKWQSLTTAEIKTLWNLTKKPSEFAEMLLAKVKEKNVP